jgi:HK97 family phage prohead protease
MLIQHDPAQPIGAWDEIREDARGLYVRGHLIAGSPRACEILALIRGRALDGLSIGFRARRASRDARTGQRRLYDIDLWEISIVTFPMLPGARVTAIKSSATAAFPLARPRLAAIPPSPMAAPRSPYSATRRRSLERRSARPGEGAIL